MKVRLEIDNAQELANLKIVKSIIDNTLADISAVSGSSKSFRFGFNVTLPSGYFLAVTETDGTTSYFEGGTLYLNSQGAIVDKNAKVLQPSVTVPFEATEIGISANGEVSVDPNGNPIQLGTLNISKFTNPAGLTDLGNGYYAASADSGLPVITQSNNLIFSIDGAQGDITFPIIVDKEVSM